jgi:hypothetical protein
MTTKPEKKLSKLEVAATLSGKGEWTGFRGTITRWVKANGVSKHLEGEVAKQGRPSDPGELEEWEQIDMKIFVAIEAKLSQDIQATISSADSAAEMWGRLWSTYEVTDMVAIVTAKRALYSHRMLEGEKIEDHLCEMQKNIDLLRGINISLATPFDWMVALVASLPVHLLQLKYHFLTVKGTPQLGLYCINDGCSGSQLPCVKGSHFLDVFYTLRL